MDYPANTLSPLDLQAKALTELNETEDCRRQGLAFLRDAIAEPKYDGLFAYHEARRDLFLLAFLRWRKFDCRRALRSLVRFSRFRTAHPAFFTGNVHNLALFMDHGMIRILPKRTPQGCAIAVCDWALFNRDRFTYEDEMRAVVQLALSLISSVQTQVAGVVLIENLHGFRMPPMAEVLKTMELVQGCLPLRLHRIPIRLFLFRTSQPEL
ncbi:unnamed protein product (mitochondrion) [Plasmodiophora brassicae]|uniref:CRAL-TRIO domain-containing protein n=1 Tax=Plasmodiophora brassicae TaxID=37360 RepID=A0A3P3Y400_PLABS|nr:unnamed protein product [Plasmodiophora brassicae]